MEGAVVCGGGFGRGGGGRRVITLDPWVTPTDPKSVASASFATGPWFLL